MTEGDLKSNPFDSIKLGQLLPRDQRIIKASGVRFRNPYQTRPTCASSLLMLGALPLHVATQMGHATTMIVRTYLRDWTMDAGKGFCACTRRRIRYGLMNSQNTINLAWYRNGRRTRCISF